MKKLKICLVVATFIIFSCACSSPLVENRAGISKKAFDKIIDGKQVSLWTLKNKNGAEMCVTNFGGKVVSLFVPDKNNNFVNVVTGFENIDKYLAGGFYFGAVIGRVGNRIAHGKFSLNGIEYHLAVNNGPNHLHGGLKGFNSVVWDAKQIDKSTLELSYLSKDMEEGYPGNLQVKMVYKLTDNNEFAIEYYATTDKPTVCNLSHHSFFNLSGEGNETMLDHVLQINADGFTVTDATSIPTGEIVPVTGTPLDFRTPTVIGERIEFDYEAIKIGSGYDHNYVLKKSGNAVDLAATVFSPVTGIQMDVYTDQPGMQFYTGNFLSGNDIGISNKPYKRRSAFSLETQHYPDSPNKPNFPSVTLNPGETYRHTCIYKFSVKK